MQPAFARRPSPRLFVAVWLAFPAQRMVLVPLVIVIAYLPTMWWLERRWRANRNGPAFVTA